MLKRADVIDLLLLVAIVTLLGAYAFLSVNVYFVVSELWAVGSASTLQPYYRVFFNLLNFLPSTVGLSGVDGLIALRILYFGNALLTVYLCVKIAALVFGGLRAGLVCALVLLLHTTFLVQSYRIRADNLSTTFILLALYLVVKNQDKLKSLHYGVGACVAAAFFATPKSIYLIFGQLLVLRKKLTAKIVVPSLAVVTSLILLVPGQVFESYLEALRYFWQFHKNESVVGVPAYFSQASFSFLVRSFETNPWFYILYVVSFFWFIKNKSPQVRTIVLMSAVAFGAAIIHNDKLPFFISSLLPFMAIAISGLLVNFPRELKHIISIGAIFVFFVVFGRLSAILEFDSNKHQIQNFSYLDQFLQRYPGAKYFDGVSILRGARPLLYYLGPGQGDKNTQEFMKMMSEEPEFIFASQRLGYAWEDFKKLSLGNYVDFGDSIYGRAVKVEQLPPANSQGQVLLSRSWVTQKLASHFKQQFLNKDYFVYCYKNSVAEKPLRRMVLFRGSVPQPLDPGSQLLMITPFDEPALPVKKSYLELVSFEPKM